MTYSKYLNSTLSIVHRVPAKLTPICAAILLSGCMGSEEYKITEKVVYEKQQYQDKGGIAGRVIGKGYIEDATVCFDRNLDGACNSSEDKTTSFKNGRFSFTEEVSTENAGHILLAEVNVSGEPYILVTKPNSTAGAASNITLFTTLVARAEDNGLADSLIANTNLEDNVLLLGRDYVEDVDVDSLTDEQKEKRRQVAENAKHLVKSYIKAYPLNETEPFKTVDFVVREVNSQKTFALSFTVALEEPTPIDFTPTISLEGEKNISIIVGSTYEELGATAVDSLGNTLPVTISGTVNTGSIGIFVILYSVEDANGNTATDSRKVTVIQPTSTPQVTSSTTIPMPVQGVETYQITVVDADSDAFTYSITTQPSQLLSATVDDSGLVTFSNLGEYQQDSFIIEVSDGENTVSETITIEASVSTELTFTKTNIQTQLTMSAHSGHTHPTADNEHEFVIGATFNNSKNKLITASNWHNKLNILDISDKTQAPSEKFHADYLWVDAGTDQTDSTSGASGQDLTKLITRDGNNLFSLIENAEKNNGKNSEGIYHLDISGNSFSGNLKYAESQSKTDVKRYYLNKYLSDMDVSSDGTKLVACESKSSSGDRKLLYFANSTDLSSYAEISTGGKRVKTVSFSQDGNLIYAGVSVNYNNEFAIYDTQSKLGSINKMLVPGLGGQAAYPSSILSKSQNEVFIAVGTKAYLLNTTDKNNITLIGSPYEATEEIKNLTMVSFEGDEYLLAVQKAKKMTLFKLDGSSTRVEVTVPNDIKDATQIGDGLVAVTQGSKNNGFFVSYYKLANE